MRLFQQLFASVAFVFGLYYFQSLLFGLVTRWNLYMPFFEALPFEVMIYLFVVTLLLMTAIIYLSHEERPIYALALLLHVPWLLLFPLVFIPSVPLFLFYLNARSHNHPAQSSLLPLVVGYLILSIAPLFGSLVLFLAWGYVSSSHFLTKKRSV
jgi:hypothetical protein